MMINLTPKEIVDELDKYIIGQRAAKKAVAIAMRNRWRRRQVEGSLNEEITPKNIILIGPTGVGKTEVARRLAKLVNAPFLKIEATTFTEVGYVGRNVESIIHDLADVAFEKVKAEYEGKVYDRALLEADSEIQEKLKAKGLVTREEITKADGSLTESLTSQTFEEKYRDGKFEQEMIEIDLADPSVNGEASSGADLTEMLGAFFKKSLRQKRCRVHEARRLLVKERSLRLVDTDAVKEEALLRTSQMGIVFIDEIDKIAVRETVNPGVSRQGVQRDLLPIVEGSAVSTKLGVVQTEHILFIAAGAFNVSKPADLIPEFQGRFPIRVELEPLSENDFTRILREPKNSLPKQYIALMETEGVSVRFTDEAIELIAELAFLTNQNLENIGARRLHTIIERVFEDLSFELPNSEIKDIIIDENYVRTRLEHVVKDQDLSRFIL